jgi:hypothetical protein
MSEKVKEIEVSAEMMALAKSRVNVLLDHFAVEDLRRQSVEEVAIAIYLQGVRDGMDAAFGCSDEPEEGKREMKVTEQ